MSEQLGSKGKVDTVAVLYIIGGIVAVLFVQNFLMKVLMCIQIVNMTVLLHFQLFQQLLPLGIPISAICLANELNAYAID